MEVYSEVFVSFLTRIFLGILFVFQGYDKVFRIKPSGVVKMFEYPFRQTGLPVWILYTGVYVTSVIELSCGLLLIIGLFKYYALYLLGIDLLLVSFGLGLINPMWDVKHAWPRLLLLILLLLLPSSWDTFSLDYLLNH
jgi:putative oxidoreductase